MSFDLNSYGPAVAGLLAAAPCNDLGPGSPHEDRRRELAAFSPEELVAPHPLQQREMARAALAGLWLRYDFLDKSHRISQDLSSTTGSYWHGIMHRREPDYGNAKYWFRRVGSHPVFGPLRDAAAQLAGQCTTALPAAALVEQPEWDPFAFVDLCQTAAGGPAELRTLCMQIQQREWEILFDFCYRQAIT